MSIRYTYAAAAATVSDDRPTTGKDPWNNRNLDLLVSVCFRFLGSFCLFWFPLLFLLVCETVCLCVLCVCLCGLTGVSVCVTKHLDSRRERVRSRGVGKLYRLGLNLFR